MNTFKFIVLLSVLGSFTASCNQQKQFEIKSEPLETPVDAEVTHAENEDEWLKETLVKYQNDSNPLIQTQVVLKLFASTAVIDFYKKNDFQQIWVNASGLNKNGQELYKVLQQTKMVGLPNKNYGFDEITSSIEKLKESNGDKKLLGEIELSLTNAWYLLALHLHAGAVGDNQLLNKNFGNNTAFYTQTLQKSLDKNTLTTSLQKLQPQDYPYNRLLTALKDLSNSKTIFPKGFYIPDHKADSVKCELKTIEALVYQGFLDSAKVSHNQYLTALKKFQKMNGLEADGIPGPNTRSLLLLDNEEKYKRIAINVDRWRSKNYHFPDEYIFVNIPSFELFWIKDQQIIHKHKVIVGKTNSTTPEIISEINRIVINPDWSVPQSIIKGELRHKSAGYLSRYKIYQNGVRVSPWNVRWSAGGVRVVQPPGPTNALGNIKFLFKNNFSVYLHDTPSRSLFGNTVRAYSHGCVRVQNPLELGVNLLNRDSIQINLDSIQKIVSTRNLTNISLNQKMPIYLQYYTTIAFDNDTPNFFPDIYKREEAYASVLFYGKYDQVVSTNKAIKDIPSIQARPKVEELPSDSISQQATP